MKFDIILPDTDRRGMHPSRLWCKLQATLSTALSNTLHVHPPVSGAHFFRSIYSRVILFTFSTEQQRILPIHNNLGTSGDKLKIFQNHRVECNSSRPYYEQYISCILYSSRPAQPVCNLFIIRCLDSRSGYIKYSEDEYQSVQID